MQLPVRERAELAEVYRNNFARFADMALSAGDDTMAFEAAQLASLSESAVNAHMMARRASLPGAKARGLFADLEVKQAELFRLERERAFALGKSDLTVREAQAARDAASLSLGAINDALAAEVSGFRDLMQPNPVSLEMAKSRLAPKRLC